MPKKKEMKRCQYKRLDGKPCPHDYFATYADPATGEGTDYCIFHAPMDLKGKKTTEDFWDAFDELYNETLFRFEAEIDEEKKKEIRLDCLGFVFPDTGDRFESKEFPFSVSFLWATFSGVANFKRATLSGFANFAWATFSQKAYFRWAKFANGARFWNGVFSGGAYFYGATFSGKTEFFKGTFSGEAEFIETTFSGGVEFIGGIFSSEAYFSDARFSRRANFKGATFERNADFQKLIVIGNVGFGGIEFPESVSFVGSCICGEVKFPDTVFLGKADFRGIKMYLVDNEGKRTDPDAAPGVLLFDNTYFDQPERIQLGGKETDLGQWSFKDTNIEKVNFVNEEWKPNRRYWINPFKRLALFIVRKFKRDWEPKWRWRDKYEVVDLPKSFLSLLRRKGRKVIYDEILANEDKDKRDPEKRVTWEDAGQVYRRLRKKFEGELAYELTSDFHYGQMECRRLNSDRPLLHPDRVVAFLYKIVSGYGERFGLPLLWLGLSLIVFTGAFMFLGYKPAGEKEVIWRFCSPGEMFPSGFWNWVLDLGKAVTFTVRAAVSFRLEDITKDPVIFLAHFWKLFAVIFGTFFILALRRRFKK